MDEENEGIKKVDIGGETFTVPEKLAEALERQSKTVQDLSEGYQRSQEQVRSLSEKIDNLSIQKPEEPEGIGVDDLDIWTDPEAYIDSRMKAREKEIADAAAKAAEERINKKIDAEKRANGFWERFYTKNGDLKDHDFFVKSILQRDMDELGNMTESKAISELSDRVRAEILKFAPKQSKKEEVILEEASSSPFDFNQATPKQEEDEDMSLGAIVKKRRKQMRAVNK